LSTAQLSRVTHLVPTRCIFAADDTSIPPVNHDWRINPLSITKAESKDQIRSNRTSGKVVSRVFRNVLDAMEQPIFGFVDEIFSKTKSSLLRKMSWKEKWFATMTHTTPTIPLTILQGFSFGYDCSAIDYIQSFRCCH
jgi:hypothetical protein